MDNMNMEPFEKASRFNSKLEKEEVEKYSVASAEKGFVYSEAELKLIKKMNRTFGPFLCAALFLQFVDKSTLSVVSVLPDFFLDTGITQNQYSWVGSFFYLGFLMMQPFNQYMIQRFPLAKYVGSFLVAWGIALLCMAFAHNFSQLAALRWMLGFLEAITYPSMFLLVGSLYRRSEQVIWFGVMFISNSVSGVVGNLVGVGILQMPTYHGIHSWQWAFLIFGSLTILAGFIFFVFMPDSPFSKWFRLTEEEKLIVKDRIRDNAVVRSQKIKWAQIFEGLKDLRFYAFVLISFFMNFQNGALTIFSGIIISQMGFSSTNAVLLTIPFSFATMLFLFVSSRLSAKFNEVCLVAICTTTISMIGLIILVAIPSGSVKLLGLYLSGAGTSTYSLMQTSITGNVSGYTKKIFYTGGNLVFYTFGNFIGPLLLRSEDKPRYILGVSVYVGCNACVVLLFAFIRYSLVQANKRRHLDKNSTTVALPDDLEDITDVQNEHFVYRT